MCFTVPLHVNLGFKHTTLITDWHSPLLKRSQHVAFYVRRIWLDACQWRPAGTNKHLNSVHADRQRLGFSECALEHVYVSECSYFEDEVWRRARSHCGSEDPVMVRVDQRLVQVQNQNLPLYCIWSSSHNMDTCDTLYMYTRNHWQKWGCTGYYTTFTYTV